MSEEPYNFADVFQSVFIPKQKPAPPPVPEDKMAFISTYPPLGQVTQLKGGVIEIVAVLEVPQFLENAPWQLALWHSGEGGEWVETPLTLSQHGNPSSLQLSNDKLSRLYFTTRLSIQSSLSFTLKFRQQSEHEWRWIRDEQHVGDGFIIIDGKPTLEVISDNLSDLIHDLNPNLKWKSLLSQCPGTRLWSVEHPVNAVENDKSALLDIPLGVPWGKFLR